MIRPIRRASSKPCRSRGYRFIAPVTRRSPRQRRAGGPVSERRDVGSRGRGAARALLAALMVFAALVSGRPDRRGCRDRARYPAASPWCRSTTKPAWTSSIWSRGPWPMPTVARLATPRAMPASSVIGNAAVLYQPRAFRDLKRIGLELGADYIVLAQMKTRCRPLDGSGGQVRLIAHLIRVPDEVARLGQHLRPPEFTLGVQAGSPKSIASVVHECSPHRPHSTPICKTARELAPHIHLVRRGGVRRRKLCTSISKIAKLAKCGDEFRWVRRLSGASRSS